MPTYLDQHQTVSNNNCYLAMSHVMSCQYCKNKLMSDLTHQNTHQNTTPTQLSTIKLENLEGSIIIWMSFALMIITVLFGCSKRGK